MSIHPSLAQSEKDKKVRSVLKRTERLKIMSANSQWKEGDNVYGLPKIKTVRIRIKKEKAAKETAETVAATATGAALPVAAGTGKEKPAGKASAAKAENKK